MINQHISVDWDSILSLLSGYMQTHHTSSTICALSTANGSGAIAVIRVSGKDTFSILGNIFSKDLKEVKGNTIHFGNITEGETVVDEVLVAVFRAPHSFTGEDVAEISCHGSRFIQQQILRLLLQNGGEAARAGEFTQRAFLNGKMDLSQAEAVADLIASESAAAHRLAMQQMKGGFSKAINRLREELIHFASMIELELDFSEEDVEFADRSQLKILIANIQQIIVRLMDSFAYGNVIKNGIPVAIVGIPNVGKSTLLNALLEEEKAIVSDIPGTTRDAIEDELIINGVEFRFIDTAGLRETKDVVENIGIEKTYKKIEEAQIVLYLVSAIDIGDIAAIEKFKNFVQEKGKRFVLIINKTDLADEKTLQTVFNAFEEKVFISAKQHVNLQELKDKLFAYVSDNNFYQQDIIVTNARHHAALQNAHISLNAVSLGMDQHIPGDLLAIDIRKAIFHLSEITGEISTDDLLGNIFSKFCIGK